VEDFRGYGPDVRAEPQRRDAMNRSLAILTMGCLGALVAASTSFAETDRITIVTGHYRGLSADDRAIDACAKTMVARMFPGTERIRVNTNDRGHEVFGDPDDNALPGFEMAVLLTATDAKTGAFLGTAECDVTPNAKVTELRPGAKDLAQDADAGMVE
jgi:hypothetical protein